jgi:peptidoglycan/xylan/chitin deacetylase (PgdA/CDA1 family)
VLIKRALLVTVSLLYWAAQTVCNLLVRRSRARSVVLYYHGVRDEQRARFHAQMSRLVSWTQVVPLARLLQPGRAGWKVCLTFDDGFDSVRRNALPSLVQLNLPASVFVVTGNLGRRPEWPIDPRDPDTREHVMTAEQVLELSRANVEIGSHTVSHANLARLHPDELRVELLESKRALEALLGAPVRTLSLPFGAYDRETLRAARDAGYELTLTVDPQPANSITPSGVCGRFKTDPDDWRIEFWLKARGAYAWRKYVRPLRRVWSALRTRVAGPRMELSAALSSPGPQD